MFEVELEVQRREVWARHERQRPSGVSGLGARSDPRKLSTNDVDRLSTERRGALKTFDDDREEDEGKAFDDEVECRNANVCFDCCGECGRIPCRIRCLKRTLVL